MGYQISAESLPLIIMQCKNCNSIVGDTSEFVCAASWNDNRLVVLGGELDLGPQEKSSLSSPPNYLQALFARFPPLPLQLPQMLE